MTIINKRALNLASMSIIRKIESCFEYYFPSALSESWDNVGIIAESPNENGSNILLAIDCTEEVVNEAILKKCGAIIAYHPPWFTPQKKLLLSSSTCMLNKAIAHGVSIFSPHTTIDSINYGSKV